MKQEQLRLRYQGSLYANKLTLHLLEHKTEKYNFLRR